MRSRYCSHGVEDPREIARLGEAGRGTRIQKPGGFLRRASTGVHYDADAGRDVFDDRQRLRACHPRHLHIQQQHIDLAGAGQVDSFFAILNSSHDAHVRGFPQHLNKNAPDEIVVVSNSNSNAR